MHHTTHLAVLALVTAVAACAPPSADPRPPRDAPDDVVVTPSITFVDVTEARDVSPDGKTVLLEALGYGRLSMYDVDTGELTQDVATMPFVERNQALGVSNNGRISAEVGDPVSAKLWSGTEWTDLGSPFAAGCVDASTGATTDIAGAWDVSGAGDVVVGLAYDGCTPTAYRWESGAFTVLERLGSPFEAGREPVSRASVVSDDGRVVAGWAENGPVDRSPAIWNADGSGFMLDPDDRDRPGEVLAISGDGHAVAGVWANEGFVYTQENGVTMIGKLPNAEAFDNVYVNALALDGDLLLGACGFTAFVWTPQAGMRDLRSVLIDAGLEIPDTITLVNVGGISGDGTVVAGTAIDTATDPFGVQRSFVLVLPVSAYGA